MRLSKGTNVSYLGLIFYLVVAGTNLMYSLLFWLSLVAKFCLYITPF